MTFYTVDSGYRFMMLDDIAKELVQIDPSQFSWEERDSSFYGSYNFINEKDKRLAKIMLNNGSDERSCLHNNVHETAAIIHAYDARIQDYLLSKPDKYVFLEIDNL